MYLGSLNTYNEYNTHIVVLHRNGQHYDRRRKNISHIFFYLKRLSLFHKIVFKINDYSLIRTVSEIALSGMVTPLFQYSGFGYAHFSMFPVRLRPLSSVPSKLIFNSYNHLYCMLKSFTIITGHTCVPRYFFKHLGKSTVYVQQ